MRRSTTVRSLLRLRSALGLLAAAGFLAFTVAQAPHLVHHLFERGQKHADCAFASAGERTHGLVTDGATLIPGLQVVPGEWVADRSILPGHVLISFEARAPPSLLS